MKHSSPRWIVWVLPCLLVMWLVGIVLWTQDAGLAEGQTGEQVTGQKAREAADITTPAMATTPPVALASQGGGMAGQEGLKAWLLRVEQAADLPPQERAAFFEEGLKLAAERGVRMRRLIREDPQAALAEALTLDQYARLPEGMKALVERPFSERASYVCLPVCRPTEGDRPAGTPDHVALLTLADGSELNAFTYGRRSGVMSKDRLPAQGIALGRDAALHDGVFRPLLAQEMAVARELYPEAAPLTRSFVTGQPIVGDPVLAVAGGRVYAFASVAELQELDQKLAALDDKPGPKSGSQVLFEPRYQSKPAAGGSGAGGFDLEGAVEASTAEASDWTETKKRVFIIRVDFSDNTGESHTQAATAGVLNGSVSDQILTMSYGKTWIEAGVSANVYRLPSTAAFYSGGGLNTELLRDARNTFRTNKSGADAVINIGPVHNSGSGNNGLGDYDIVGVLFKSVGMVSGGVNYAGLAGGADLWMQGTISAAVFTHEFGHNYGIGHASFWQTSDGSVVGTGANVEYGDDFDIMGDGDLPHGHFHAQAKERLSWLSAGEWADATVMGNQTYRLFRIDSAGTAGSPRGIRVTKGASEYYWMSYRKAYGANAHFDSGVYLTWQRPGNTRCWLLDTTPSTSGDKSDAPVVLGRTYSDSSAQVHITPIAKGGSGTEAYLDVVINSGTFPGNAAPTSSAITGPDVIAARTVHSYSVSASDPNEDALSYWWRSGDGMVTEDAASIMRSWTVGGSYTLDCTVSDRKGGTVTVSKNITVTDPVDTWTLSGASTTASFRDALYAKGRFVVASYWGELWFSWDGTTWTSSGEPVDMTQPRLAYGNQVFVAIGEHASGGSVRAAVSMDGRRWTEATVPAGAPKVNAVTFANGQFVAVGEGGAVYTSTDGMTWALHTIPGAGTLSYVAWGGSAFVIAGDNDSASTRRLWSSTTGTSWTQHESDVSHLIYGLHYRGDRLFKTGWYGNIEFSTDNGLTWNRSSLPGERRWSTWSLDRAEDGSLVAIARDMDVSGSPYGLLVSQDNGVSWVKSQGASATTVASGSYQLIYAEGRFWNFENNGGVRQTNPFYPANAAPSPSFVIAPTTGSARTAIAFSGSATDPDSVSLNYAWDFGPNVHIGDGATTSANFTFGGSYPYTLHVSDGRGGRATLTETLLVSDPARSFTQRTSGTTNTLNTITCNATTAVAAGGTGGVIRTSSDGVSWTTRTISSNTNVHFLGSCWTGSHFILVGQDYNFGINAWINVIATSPDGVTWTRSTLTSTASTELNAVATSGSVHVAVGRSGRILRSTNGTSWTVVSISGLTSTIAGIAYGEGTFVLSAYSSGNGTPRIFTSTDGENWMETTSGAALASWQDLRGLAYLSDRFVGSGWYSKLRISLDSGATFTAVRPDNEECPGLAYGRGIWFGAGVNRSASDADVDILSLDGTNWNSYPAPTTADRRAATFFNNTFITVGVGGEIWQSDVIPSASTAPTITALDPVAIPSGANTGALAFTIGDAETPAAALTVSASSSNTSLVPLGSIALGGSGATRTVTVTPVSGLTGTATITLTVSDGVLTASAPLLLTVTSSYTSWMAGQGLLGADPIHDNDKDGLSNIMEYALGSDPSAADAAPGSFDGTVITYLKGADAMANGDMTWIIETSENLAPNSWSPQVIHSPGNPALTISHALTPGPSGAKFARLRVVHTP